jgi:hypothetical protein
MNDTEIEITCENCGSTTRKDLAWVKDHSEYECGCGTMIAVDASKFRRDLVDAESELDGSAGLLAKLGK